MYTLQEQQERLLLVPFNCFTTGFMGSNHRYKKLKELTCCFPFNLINGALSKVHELQCMSPYSTYLQKK